MILDRFDGVVFIGDDMLHHIYAAFNILLREDLALGGLEHWRMSGEELKVCRCDNQFTRAACKGFMVGSSEGVQKHNTDGGHGSPYACNSKCSVHALGRWVAPTLTQGPPTSSSPSPPPPPPPPPTQPSPPSSPRTPHPTSPSPSSTASVLIASPGPPPPPA